MAESIKPATHNVRLSYLKSFFDWCVWRGLCWQPGQGPKKPKAEDRIVNIDVKVLSRLIGLPDHKTFAGLRDYALILLQLDTAIRPMEAFGLLETDINLRGLEVYVRADC